MFGMLEPQSPRADFNLAILKTMVLQVMELKWSSPHIGQWLCQNMERMYGMICKNKANNFVWCVI